LPPELTLFPYKLDFLKEDLKSLNILVKLSKIQEGLYAQPSIFLSDLQRFMKNVNHLFQVSLIDKHLSDNLVKMYLPLFFYNQFLSLKNLVDQ